MSASCRLTETKSVDILSSYETAKISIWHKILHERNLTFFLHCKIHWPREKCTEKYNSIFLTNNNNPKIVNLTNHSDGFSEF